MLYIPDLAKFAMVTVPHVFTSSPLTTNVIAPNVASVMTTPVIASTVPSAGTQLKPDETPKVSTVITAAQPSISVPKPEVVAVTQPQPTPFTEPNILVSRSDPNQVIGPSQVIAQPAAPTIVVRTTTPPKSYSGLVVKCYKIKMQL